jgi:glycosyltransferase involved in cell wall biosynthesis
MEAMASGVPAVGARAGGIPDVIQDGETGLMFTPGDLGDLTDKLARLLHDAPLRRRLGEAARADMERWSWRASTEALLEHYRRAQLVHRRFDPPSMH